MGQMGIMYNIMWLMFRGQVGIMYYIIIMHCLTGSLSGAKWESCITLLLCTASLALCQGPSGNHVLHYYYALPHWLFVRGQVGIMYYIIIMHCLTGSLSGAKWESCITLLLCTASLALCQGPSGNHVLHYYYALPHWLFVRGQVGIMYYIIIMHCLTGSLSGAKWESCITLLLCTASLALCQGPSGNHVLHYYYALPHWLFVRSQMGIMYYIIIMHCLTGSLSGAKWESCITLLLCTASLALCQGPNGNHVLHYYYALPHWLFVRGQVGIMYYIIIMHCLTGSLSGAKWESCITLLLCTASLALCQELNGNHVLHYYYALPHWLFVRSQMGIMYYIIIMHCLTGSLSGAKWESCITLLLCTASLALCQEPNGNHVLHYYYALPHWLFVRGQVGIMYNNSRGSCSWPKWESCITISVALVQGPSGNQV